MNPMTEQQIKALAEELRGEKLEREALIELTAAVQVTGVKLEHIDEKLTDIRDTQKAHNQDIENRLRKVEKLSDEMRGAWKMVAALAAGIGGAIGALIEYVISHWGAKTP